MYVLYFIIFQSRIDPSQIRIKQQIKDKLELLELVTAVLLTVVKFVLHSPIEAMISLQLYPYSQIALFYPQTQLQSPLLAHLLKHSPLATMLEQYDLSVHNAGDVPPQMQLLSPLRLHIFTHSPISLVIFLHPLDALQTI